MAYTITEALQEIKTINKRLAVKRQSVGNYLGRDSRLKDPLEREGGSTDFIKRERQAISDLEGRVVKIRVAIQGSNLKSPLVVNGQTRNVAEWLTWRKEVADGSRQFLTGLSGAIKQLRDKLQREGRNVAASDSSAGPQDVIIHLDEKELVKQQEDVEVTLSELDGKLSLANATTVVDV